MKIQTLFRAHYFEGLTKHDLFKQTDKSDFYKKHKEAASTTASAFRQIYIYKVLFYIHAEPVLMHQAIVWGDEVFK